MYPLFDNFTLECTSCTFLRMNWVSLGIRNTATSREEEIIPGPPIHLRSTRNGGPSANILGISNKQS